MTRVLHAGLLAGCRKNWRPRPAGLIAELLPVWRGVHGGGERFALAPKDASVAAVWPDVAHRAALLPGGELRQRFLVAELPGEASNGRPEAL